MLQLLAGFFCFFLWGVSENPGVWIHSLFSQRPKNPAHTPMEPYRSLALLAGSLALVSALVALSTDFWLVAIGPGFSAHSGLWPKGGLQLLAGKGEWYVLSGGQGRRARGDRSSEVSSLSRLHPRDADLQHSSCPEWCGVCGPPGPVLHPLPVLPRPRPPGLLHQSLSLR